MDIWPQFESCSLLKATALKSNYCQHSDETFHKAEETGIADSFFFLLLLNIFVKMNNKITQLKLKWQHGGFKMGKVM